MGWEGATTATGLGLFSLDWFQEIYLPESDIRAVLGWGNGTIVVSFRGTVSLKNVLTDIQVRGSVWEWWWEWR